ncbi:hypothetical protein ITP53_26215 [Nonomuraea sp. K274]|uniref:Tetratricopeptide repeat protein n=1 Tax=Nonomuraea cypriaca TaxID=1187855 RepID=A0A931AFA3_9ACTN|nr:hypothetical protein [Nonomuraea cypriaca]MBF8189164.1 hypothetical protein [Nonomuraea cypriaca]
MTDDVQALLSEAGSLPYGEARTVLVERAVHEAEARREPGATVEARLALIAAYQFGGEPVKSFATFSRCLADYDAEPGRFEEWQAHRLLWQYKWIMSDLRRFPEVPLPRALDALDDMERRFRQAGDLLHAVYAERCAMALHLGDDAGVAEWFHRWRTAPRDRLSDCQACDVGSQARTLTALGRDEEAVALAAPVVTGQFTCYSQPQSILCTLLPVYLRIGRLDAAAEAHRRAYRLVQGQVADLDDFGDHLRFCALTGNETRGLEILERELPLLERPPSPSQAARFMSGAALLLRRLEEIGHGTLTVRRGDADVPVPALRAEMEAGARGIAARFDARNGNDVHSRRMEARLAATPVAGSLPLLPHARRQPSDSPEESLRAAAVAADQEEAVRHLEEAVAGFTQRGEGRGAALARVDLADAYLGADRPLDAAETAEEAVALLGAADAERLAGVRKILSRALIVLGESERALEVLRELGDAYALLEAAQAFDDRDEDREAAAAYAAAAELYERAGDLLGAANAMRLHALSIYYGYDQAEEVTAAYARARRTLDAAGSIPGAAGERAKLAYDEATALRWAGLREAAVTACQEAIEVFLALDDEDGAGLARHLLDELREEDD